MLRKCAKSKRLLDALEHGVYDALKKGYVRSVALVISHPEDHSTLLEEYLFTVEYDGAKRARLLATVKDAQKEMGKTTKKDEARLTDPKWIRKNAIATTRTLLSLMRTLDALPDGSAANLNLTYTEETPATYEPPFFQAADDATVDENDDFYHDGSKTWKSDPFTMELGKIETKYHSMTVKASSALDPLLEEEDEEEDHEHEERARTPTEKMRGMEINKWGGENRNSGSREDVMMMDANVEDVGSAEKRTKVENEKGFAYSRCKPKDEREEKERMTNATDSTAHASPLLADLREKQEALEDAETYDALMKVLDTFEVVPSFETKRPMVDERLVRLVTQTLERFVVPFEDDAPSSKKSDLKLSDEDYILRDSGVPVKNPKVKRMVDALRVMYVNQLRVTQDRADDILLQVQSRVADPRTDSKQGRVGR